MNTELLNSIAAIVEILIATTGFVFAAREFYRGKHSKVKQELIEQVVAYYYEEQEAIKWIAELSQEKAPNIQQQLRAKAKNNVNNGKNTYPNMTPSKAESYL